MVKKGDGRPASFYFNSVLIILAVVVVGFFLFYPSAGTGVSNYFFGAESSSTSFLKNQAPTPNSGGGSGGDAGSDFGSGVTPTVAGSSGGGGGGGGAGGNVAPATSQAGEDDSNSAQSVFVCNNGIYELGEACDNGGGNGDGCSNSCQVESGWICLGFPGESSECIIDDSGGVQGGSGSGSTPAGGTGSSGSQTDDGSGGSGGSTQCGDGTQVVPQEQCDDGNQITEVCTWSFSNKGPCNVCNSACQLVSSSARYCGDGIRQSSNEACDDGNSCDTDACKNDCTLGLGTDSCAGGGEAFFAPLFKNLPFSLGASPHAVLSEKDETASNGLIIPVLIVIVLLVVWFARAKPAAVSSVFSFKIF